MINFQTPRNLRSAPNAHVECSASQLFGQIGQANTSIQFPVFDGDNPQMWQILAEQYFDMFAIHDSYWVSMAILNFVGPPKVWLHSVRKKVIALDWGSFCALLCTRFGRDKHQLLIQQFYSLKQTGTVTDYIEQFETVMNNLLAYSDAIHPLYFLTRFVEGLKNEIRSVVMVQRPTDLDTACALALLQEEVSETARPAHQRYNEQPYRGRPLLLPPPQARMPVVQTNKAAVDRRGQEGARAETEANSRLATLKAYRKARGLCFTCGERWGKDHTCPATIQLHIVEELLDFMGADALGLSEEQDTAEAVTHNCYSISLQALSDKWVENDGAPTVLRLQGWVQNIPVTFLVDSGSTASFIHAKPKSQL